MSLQDDALQLIKLDGRINRDLSENMWEDFGHNVVAYMELRRGIQKRILDLPSVPIEDTAAADVLRKIVNGEGLPSDRVIEHLVRNSDKDYKINAFTNEELDELGHELFYPWFSHYDYIQGLAELRPLILRHTVPEHVSRLVTEIKECYAFQQYDATYSMCRTLIEACIRDICVRKKHFPDRDDDAVLLDKISWRDLSNTVAPSTTRDQLNKLYSELSTLVHGRTTVTQHQARDAFKATLELIEEMYAK